MLEPFIKWEISDIPCKNVIKFDNIKVMSTSNFFECTKKVVGVKVKKHTKQI